MRRWHEGVAGVGCSSCGHDNEANAKFCSECGASLMAKCGSCQADQPPGAKFCNQCGSPITATSAPDPGAEQRAPASNAVRKNVTALFGDLVGSTAFGERVDPEAARSALAPYFEILRSTIDDHAGTCQVHSATACWRCSACRRSPRTTRSGRSPPGSSCSAGSGRSPTSPRAARVELGLRVGINTGELVIGDDDADLVGDVLNTAPRLEAACEPGRVLVGEDTWRLTRSNVAYEVLGEVRVKGKADAVATFQVVERRPGRHPRTRHRLRRPIATNCDARSAFDETRSRRRRRSSRR
jgi:class 3 adenylate cyclase